MYLDNAATTQKPKAVIDREVAFYERDNANVHRAPHDLAGRATLAYEAVREKVKRFINASSEREIIFTRGTTESINLIANSYGSLGLRSGDEILLTELEHHSNIVPWQLLAERVGAKIIAAPISERGDLDLRKFRDRLNLRTKIVSFTHVSNALGTVNPVAEVVALVRKHAPQAVIVVDGAQWVAHSQTDVRSLGVDFYVFSAHKLFAPTGVGVLYGRQDLLERMPPFLGGGDMIERVSFRGSTFAGVPSRFEAGTPNIGGVIGFGAALDFLLDLDWQGVAEDEHLFSEIVKGGIESIPGVRLVGQPKSRLGVASFLIDGLAPIDAAVLFNQQGIALRAGHHCCMPLMERLGVSGTVRVSWSIYNSSEEANVFVEALRDIATKRTKKTLSQLRPALNIEYAPASAPSVTEAAKAISALFNGCEDNSLKQELLFELGQEHPNMLAALRTITPPVPGCMSEVRVVTKISDEKLYIASDSNAAIVRGLLAIVEKLCSGQTLAELKALSIPNFFDQLGVNSFLSVQRRSGLSSVLKLIEEQIGHE